MSRSGDGISIALAIHSLDPTKDAISDGAEYKCYNQSEALNELSNYKLPVVVTYRYCYSIDLSSAHVVATLRRGLTD